MAEAKKKMIKLECVRRTLKLDGKEVSGIFEMPEDEFKKDKKAQLHIDNGMLKVK